MSEACRCGHADTAHECIRCSCTDFDRDEPAKQEAPQWLDAPTDTNGDWWVYNTGNAFDAFTVTNMGGKWQRNGVTFELGAHLKWQKAKVPTPPPAPLPSSRSVTLSAKVRRINSTGGEPDLKTEWLSELCCSATSLSERAWHSSRETALKWVRDTYNIEPEVSDE